MPPLAGAVPVREASALLNRALSRSAIGHEVRVALAQFPIVKPIIERLAWYVTDQMPVPVNFARSLLALCLVYAQRQLTKAQAASLSPVSNAVRNAWVSGLYWHVPMMVEVDVAAGDEHWDPFAGEPLGLWLKSHGQPSFRLVTPADGYAFVSPRVMRMAVAAATMKPDELAELGLSLEAIAAYEIP